jgi:hypothetical protein
MITYCYLSLNFTHIIFHLIKVAIFLAVLANVVVAGSILSYLLFVADLVLPVETSPGSFDH